MATAALGVHLAWYALVHYLYASNRRKSDGVAYKVIHIVLNHYVLLNHYVFWGIRKKGYNLTKGGEGSTPLFSSQGDTPERYIVAQR